MIGGLAGVDRDVIPFAIVAGERGKLRGLNLVGLRRSGYAPEVIKAISRAFMYIFKGKEDNFETRVQKAKELYKDNEMVMEQLEFITVSLDGKRNVMVSD
jgi:UDP-N-acetylglucosamine acyltransferase